MKRLYNIFTSRLLLVALSILIQMIIICAIMVFFSGLFLYYYIVSFAVSLVISISVINKNVNSGYKIAWILLLLGIPLFGVALYIVLDGSAFRRIKVKKMLGIVNKIKDNLASVSEIRFNSNKSKLQSDYITKQSYSPPVKNTRSKYFSDGRQYFESLLIDLQSAEKSIYIEYFIIKESYMWDEIKKVLIDKARKGVQIKILYDDVGSIDRFSKKECILLKKEGIKVRAFNPFIPVLSTVLNYRDHRKIVSIDTKIAYCGGVNVADEYINRKNACKFGYFKDSGIALYGEAAFSFEVFFLTIWEYATGEKVALKRPEYEKINEGIFQPYTDSPVDDEQVGESIYKNIISRAEKYVYISTPYFVVNDEMLSTILTAAKSGVDIRMIFPHIPDKKAINQVTKSYYTRLIDAGVKVYEYKKGFNHSKIVISDDSIATVGSVNFDYRSFFLSFECGLWINNSETVNDVLSDFNTMLIDCVRITKEDCKVSLIKRVFRAILAAFAPMF